MRWGDADFEGGDGEVEAPAPYETEPDENGVKTIVSYDTKEDGTKVKITKKVKVTKTTTKVSKAVLARRKWTKFGDCQGEGPGPQAGSTGISDDIKLEMVEKQKKPKVKQESDTKDMGIICRYCGAVGDHWTLKCPLRHKFEVPGGDDEDEDGPSIGMGRGRGGPGGEGRSALGLRSYIPPNRREDREEATVRVSNLSEETDERDIQDLFKRYGPIQRIYLAKDKYTGMAKGFAFVNFYSRPDAERAIKELDGHGFLNLIMHCEWARPSTRERY